MFTLTWLRRLVSASEPPASAGQLSILTWILGLLGVLPLVFITPPFQVPDETQHFERAYQISDLRIWSVVQNGMAGDVLPSSIPAMMPKFTGTTELDPLPGHPKVPLSVTVHEFHTPLNPRERTFVNFAGAAFYSPLPYIPQATAIGIGRMFELGPLPLLYLGRLLNAIAAIGILAWAVRVLPCGREMMMLCGLLPMTLYEFASVSPDAAVISCAFLFTSIATRAHFRGKWTKAEVVIAALTGAVFGSLKPVYLPLLLVGLVPDIFHRERIVHTLKVNFAIFAVGVGMTLGWLYSTSSAILPRRPGVNTTAQVRLIAQDPLNYYQVLERSVVTNTGAYYRGLVGILGWRRIELPSVFYSLTMIAFLTLLLLGRRNESSFAVERSLWQLFLVSISAVLVMTALYILWTPVGWGIIIGVQGRYFLPLVAMFVLSVCSLTQRLEMHRLSRDVLIVMVVLGIIVTDCTLIQAFNVI